MSIPAAPIESLPYELRKSVVSFISSEHPTWPTKVRENGLNVRKDLVSVIRLSKDWKEVGESELYKIVHILNRKALRELAYLNPNDRKLRYMKELSIDMLVLTSSDILLFHLLFSRLLSLSSISIFCNCAIWNILRSPLVHLQVLKNLRFDLRRSFIVKTGTNPFDEYINEVYLDSQYFVEDDAVTIAGLPNLQKLENLIFDANSLLTTPDNMENFLGTESRPDLQRLSLNNVCSSEISPLFPQIQNLKDLRIHHCDQDDFLSILPINLQYLRINSNEKLVEQFKALTIEPLYPLNLKHLHLNKFNCSNLPFIPSTVTDLILESPSNIAVLASALELLQSVDFQRLTVQRSTRGWGAQPDEDPLWKKVLVECERLAVELELEL